MWDVSVHRCFLLLLQCSVVRDGHWRQLRSVIRCPADRRHEQARLIQLAPVWVALTPCRAATAAETSAASISSTIRTFSSTVRYRRLPPRPVPSSVSTAHRTASVPISICLNRGVHPIALCQTCAATPQFGKEGKKTVLPRRQGQIIWRGNRLWLVRDSLGRGPQTRRSWYLDRTIHGNYLTIRRQNAFSAPGSIEEDREVVEEKIASNQFLEHWLDLTARPKLREDLSRLQIAILAIHSFRSQRRYALQSHVPRSSKCVSPDVRQESLSADYKFHSRDAPRGARTINAVADNRPQPLDRSGTAIALTNRSARHESLRGEEVSLARCPYPVWRSVWSCSHNGHAAERVFGPALVGR
jgi:hypothetical protein